MDKESYDHDNPMSMMIIMAVILLNISIFYATECMARKNNPLDDHDFAYWNLLDIDHKCN